MSSNERPSEDGRIKRAEAAVGRLCFGEELPPLAPDQRAALRSSIAEHGVLEPAVVSAGPACAGEVADGRVRIEICAELGIACPRSERRFASEPEFALYRLERNLKRRQLTIAQRIRLGQAYEPLERARAAERRAQAKGRPRGEKSVPVALPEERGETRERVAAIVGLKPSTYGRGSKVLREGSPRLVATFERGEETVTSAYRKLRAETRRAERERIAAELERRPPALPKGRYEVIALDPPWPGSRLPYPTMSLEAIAALPVGELLAEDGVVWLWTTNAFLFEAERIACESWGLTPREVLTWGKDRIGTGYPLRGQTEPCLLLSRGEPVFRRGSFSTLLHGDVREHSRKPDEFFTLAEALCVGRRRLEMFARERRPGWEAWGAETDLFAPKTSEQTERGEAA